MAPTPPENANAINIAIPLFYFNGFQIGLSGTETSATLMLDNVAAARIVMPLPVAKSLANALGHLVSQYETVTSTKVSSLEELLALFTSKINE